MSTETKRPADSAGVPPRKIAKTSDASVTKPLPKPNNPKAAAAAAPPRDATNVQFSLRRPTWSYIHLQHLRTDPTRPATAAQPLDAVTAHLHLTAALGAFLGLHGTAIGVDILKLAGADVWIRVPAADRPAVLAAVGGWVQAGTGEGWRVKGWSAWNPAAGGRDGAGQDLFE